MTEREKVLIVPKRDRTEKYRKAWYKFSLNKVSVAGLCIILFVLFLAIFEPVIAPYPSHIGAVVDFPSANTPPGAKYWMGTDNVGRDIMSRIFFACRGAFTMGIVVLLVAVPIGGILGLIAGYYKGRKLSTVIMRTTDVFLALPPTILALCVCAILKPTMTNSLIALMVAYWPWYSRLVYSMASSTRNEMYIKSAELLGAGKMHILFREILPNCLGPLFTKVTLDMGWVILNGATLSFVGLGEQPPTPALGTMVADGAKYLPQQWWISIFPSLAIMVIVLGFNLMGDGVKDMLSGEE
ncbi:cytochrome c550 [Spirochaetia bacterium]|nr:cytochrome c550 [Spirochaetia bacterium]